LDSKPDVLVVEVLPIISSPWMIGLAKVLGIPVVNYIQDLYPEAAEDAGMIKTGRPVSNIARWIDRLTCTWSSINLVLADSFKEALTGSRKIQEGKIAVINSWVDGSRVLPLGRSNPWREEQRISPGTSVAMFAGTMGRASGADVLVEAARELQRRKCEDMLILCIGEGVLKPSMMENAKKSDLENIRFLPFQPEEELSQVQSAADVMLLTMSERHGGSSVPSKLITYLAVGRPVLCSADANSAVAKVVESANIGLVIPPGDPIALADALIEMHAQQDRWVDAGRRARQFFEKNHDLPVAMEKFEHLVMSLTEGRHADYHRDKIRELN
jgi:colanic acid biosynthesis glycosyl transferase WcaI